MVVTTTGFENLTRQVAAALGLPGARIVTIAHPLGGVEEDAVLARAATIVEDVMDLWTSR